MNYETFKTFILVVLVGVSFILSFILWSYKPNYDLLYDTDYINEVDVGGKEKTKQELITPEQVTFFNGIERKMIETPVLQQSFVNNVVSNWVLFDFKLSDSQSFDEDKPHIAWKYKTELPAEVLLNSFSFDKDINIPEWKFKNVYFTLNDKNHSIKVTIPSVNEDEKITATIDKSEAYDYLSKSLEFKEKTFMDVVTLTINGEQIVIPKNEVEVPEKTVIASKIEPELFINALFSDPTLVTQNVRENYYTDGQRGLRMSQDDLKMDFVNPLQGNYESMSDMDLIEHTIANINEQKGWTNSFRFENIEGFINQVRFRMTYDGYGVYDNYGLTLIDQEWRNQLLYKYARPMLEVGNVLNSKDVTLPSGEQVLETIQAHPEKLKMKEIKDIRIGYFLNYVNDVRSITLEPHWFIIYENDWLKFNPNDYYELSRRGEA